MVVGGEGIEYYLRDQETGNVLLSWGETPKEMTRDVLESDEWEERSGVRQSFCMIFKAVIHS